MLDAEQLAAREPAKPDLSDNQTGVGRELFRSFRANVGSAEHGAGVAV
jgi:phosphogluconate dehydratase